jgi:hypothetical protein
VFHTTIALRTDPARRVDPLGLRDTPVATDRGDPGTPCAPDLATFTGVDLNQQAAAVQLIIGQIEQVERLADAAILG